MPRHTQQESGKMNSSGSKFKQPKRNDDDKRKHMPTPKKKGGSFPKTAKTPRR